MLLELLVNSLVGGLFVSDEANDNIAGVLGELADKLEL